VTLLLSLLWTAALAGLGVGVLARCARFLDGLERFALGSVLGLVMGSLAILVAAWQFGLSVALVGTVGLACGASSVGLALGGRAGGRDPIPEGEPKAAWKGSSRAAAGVLAALTLLWALVWLGALRVDDSGWWTPQVNLWGDWSFHFGDVTSFAYGDNFPPRHPRLAGHPYTYHYLSALTAACWVKLGVEPRVALTTLSFILCVLTTLAVFAFARRLLGDRAAAGLAIVLFLLGGGFGWVVELRQGGTPGLRWWTVWNDQAQRQAGIQWLNVMWAFLEPQRSNLYGIPLALLVLTLLREGLRTRRWTLFAGAGCVAGLLPFANLAALLALALMVPLLVLLLPSRGWILFAVASIAVGFPQLLAMQAGGGGVLHAFRWQPGWVAGKIPWVWFWLENLGLLLPLAGLGVLDRDLLRPIDRRLLLGALGLFGFGNLFVFQPWDWDNTKILLYAYLAMCVLASGVVARAWGSSRSPLIRGTCVLVVALSLVSGINLQLHQLLGDQRYVLLTREEVELATWARTHTAPHTRFLVGLQHNHPIPVLSGRSVVMSYPGWLWATGYDPAPYERDVRAMYALGPETDSLLARYDVSRVVIGPWELEHFGPDTLAWQSRFPRAYRSLRYQVFVVGGERVKAAE
jgi:hypothetical protein